MNYSLKFTGITELQDDLKKAQKMDNVKHIVAEFTAKLYREANREVPKDTWFLMRSEKLEILDNGMTGKIAFTAEYSEYVEKGTRFMYGRWYVKRSLYTVGSSFVTALQREVKGK